jgi:hypothetical protein
LKNKEEIIEMIMLKKGKNLLLKKELEINRDIMNDKISLSEFKSISWLFV